MRRNGSVAVTIVTYNSGRYIRRCLESVLDQRFGLDDIIVVDNGSHDGTMDILERFEDRVRVVYNEENRGFAAAQNQAIAMTSAEWVLVLNPDALLSSGFISSLVSAGETEPDIGTVCGKLLSMSPDFQLPSPSTFDSTGIFFTPTLRHFDRGSGQVDRGEYDRFEYVFGATGAAALYRRKMIEDVKVHGEFYDPDFFVYREDADVAWRAQLLGWKCLYVPVARGYHVRTATPANRKCLPREINMHSVKNRFLLRIKNATPRVFWRHALSMVARDSLVLLACLTHEFYSLKAFPLLWKLLPRALAKRNVIIQRRRASDSDMEQWFGYKPASLPADHILSRKFAAKVASASQ
jgi:GT2 family glycosyltransferase